VLEFDKRTPLSFPLELRDGRTIITAQDACDLVKSLTPEQQIASHWRLANRMLANAMKEPAYLGAATFSLQSALIMDGNLKP
jgi:hypothetical protein